MTQLEFDKTQLCYCGSSYRWLRSEAWQNTTELHHWGVNGDHFISVNLDLIVDKGIDFAIESVHKYAGIPEPPLMMFAL